MAEPVEGGSRGWELAGREREGYVRSMFDRIAKPYDRMNRAISLGRDERWREETVRLAGTYPGARVLDLGTGTGDLALAFARAVGQAGRVLGVDVARGMLEEAKAKLQSEQISWVRVYRANAAATGVDAHWADITSLGWMLRNVGDRQAVYAEALRVLRPGGRFVSVEMSRPESWFGRLGFWVYRHGVMRVLVRLFGGDSMAYRYLAGSTDRFPGAEALAAELKAAGFVHIRFHRRMLGAIAIHVATAPGEANRQGASETVASSDGISASSA